MGGNVRDINGVSCPLSSSNIDMKFTRTSCILRPFLHPPPEVAPKKLKYFSLTKSFRRFLIVHRTFYTPFGVTHPPNPFRGRWEKLMVSPDEFHEAPTHLSLLIFLIFHFHSRREFSTHFFFFFFYHFPPQNFFAFFPFSFLSRFFLSMWLPIPPTHSFFFLCPWMFGWVPKRRVVRATFA